MEYALIAGLNGLAYGLLLFMLSSGFTLIFSLMGVLNFAHASFYMLGAYFAYQLSQWLGFWAALLIAPVLMGVVGMAIERWCLRRVHRFGHVSELLLTFGFSYVLVEVVQLFWGRMTIDYRIPSSLDFPLFTLYGAQFSAYRGFIMLIACLMLLAIWLLIARTRIGLIIRAALTAPKMVEALGHDVPRVFMLVFGGGAALAGLAGVVGGNALVTEPAMAANLGSIVFVIAVVGGLGSLIGAFIASVLIGLLQTFAVSVDASVSTALGALGWPVPGSGILGDLARVSLSQAAPVLPFLILVLVLALRPEGLFRSGNH